MRPTLFAALQEFDDRHSERAQGVCGCDACRLLTPLMTALAEQGEVQTPLVRPPFTADTPPNQRREQP